jgi:hypothetical protein
MTTTAEFPDELDLRDRDDGTYNLLSAFRYAGSAIVKGTIEVPAGFNTDFASVPRIFRNLLPPDGPYGRAAVIHDYLYSTHGLGGELTREQCDRILLEAMKRLGVSWITRMTIFWAVRAGGQSHWDAK